jgi:hypothetical protein
VVQILVLSSTQAPPEPQSSVHTQPPVVVSQPQLDGLQALGSQI